jgi:hypothetical protein
LSADNRAAVVVSMTKALLWRAPSWAEIEAAEKEQKAP